MAAEWQCVLVPIVRTLISDLDMDPTYDDARINKLILTAAQLIKPEVDFATTYTISIHKQTITPDPVSNNDDIFIGLVSMKAALYILAGEVKEASANSIKIVDAGATIDMTNSYTAKKDLYKQMLDDYNRAKLAYSIGNLGAFRAILTPYTVFDNTYQGMPINNITFG